MNTKLFTSLTVAAALIAAGPAFGYDHSKKDDRGAQAAFVAKGSAPKSVTGYSTRSFTPSHSTAYRPERSTSTIAYSGYGYKGKRVYAFSAHPGWYPGHAYYWGGHHYRWYGNGWFIVDPAPVYVYPAPVYPVYGAPVSVRVQQALARLGFYQGPIDGIVGPGTQAAIAGYQQTNGLRVTGTINPPLVNSLGI
jgi:hypothetical protein